MAHLGGILSLCFLLLLQIMNQKKAYVFLVDGGERGYSPFLFPILGPLLLEPGF